ncbi:MAG: pyruvoyl-dependent arginine decarboxylase [Candidatus Bathyarchaeia archaeon]
MIPREFFVTSGKALSNVSELNAFDMALEKAGIGQCNLIPVSSIIPPNCQEIKGKEIPIGAITYTVMARMEGKGREKIGAGIAWAWEKNKKYGLVMETCGPLDEKGIKETLEGKLREMAKVRGIEIAEIKYRTEVLKVPPNHYGSVIAALVYGF